MSAHDRGVAIVGGGIGGLAAAIALRLRGVAASVYERHHSPTGQGAGIVCWPNACFVLDQLGVLERLRGVGGAPTAMRRIRHDGQELGALDVTRISALTGYASVSVLRRDLHQCLVDRAVELGAEVHFACRATQIRAGSGEVLFETTDAVTPRIVVGADGRMRSVARAFVAGHNEPRYQGFVNWVGIYDAPSPVFADMAIRDYWGVGLRFGIVPVTPTRAYWAAGAAQPRIAHSEPATRRHHIEQLFEGWPAPIGEILASPSAESVHEIHVHDHDPLDRWHRDNVVLIGDAAHASLPTSGQGACQALEDAWHLAAAVETQRAASLDVVFRHFTRQRLEKTRDITRAGRALARSLFETDPTACSHRDQAARALDYDQFAVNVARLWSRGLPLVAVGLRATVAPA